MQDTTPRYAPEQVIVVSQGQWRVAPVLEWKATPPGHGSKIIRDDMTLLECKTEFGIRHFGCDRAYINSELRMVVVGFDARDEVRRKWEPVPLALV